MIMPHHPLTRMCRRLLVVGLLAGALSQGCTTGPGESAGQVLRYDVTVIDTKGRLRPWIVVWGLAWYSDTTLRLNAHRPDSTGHVLLESPAPVSETPDSVWLQVGIQECTGVGAGITTVTQNNLHPQTITVIAPVKGERARLIAGESCGIGRGPYWGDSPTLFWTQLYFDSVDPPAGRWQMYFQITRANESGSFSGTRDGDILLLDLEPEQLRPDCDTRYRLHATLISGDTIATAWLEETPGGCSASPTPFELYELDEPFFP